jgi:cytochrome c553
LKVKERKNNVSSYPTLGALAAIVLMGCSKEPAPSVKAEPTAKPASSPTTPTPPAVAHVSDSEGHKAFVARCASCHGMEGKGDGPGATALNPKPRNYTDGVWQKAVTDEQIGKTIMYGGAAVGKSPNMPAQSDLQSKPEMVAALVKVVRGFGPVMQ